jgi:hypothetical protein
MVLHPGGIHICGGSKDVYVLENEIEGGNRNGITLGSFAFLDANNNDTGQWTGVLVVPEDDCSTTGTLQPPGATTGPNPGRVVSGGILTNIHIHRNRIRNMGLCGIGPVGFFNLLEVLEVITIVGLSICENEISDILLRPIEPVNPAQSNFLGYGAIGVPDVKNLSIRDNAITDIGPAPGLALCGIFVLLGEMVEISRNKILETRDWTGTMQQAPPPTGARAGITVLATPPSVSIPPSGDGTVAITSYEPGPPALRVQENVVRIALGQSLFAVGLGPFSIVNNHLSTGGPVEGSSSSLAQNVLIFNLGEAIDLLFSFNLASAILDFAQTSRASVGAQARNFWPPISSGAVTFTNNICQFESRFSTPSSFPSILIATLDHLTFGNNHSWCDALAGNNKVAFYNAVLVAPTLNVVSNRFQETTVAPVSISGITAGVFNITSQNISTHRLRALAPAASGLIDSPNLVL